MKQKMQYKRYQQILILTFHGFVNICMTSQKQSIISFEYTH